MLSKSRDIKNEIHTLKGTIKVKSGLEKSSESLE
jgi:hypothetical protein